MRPAMVAFVDALKPESVAHMPFLSSFPTIRRLRTELGYSPTCYASMLTGVHPNKHLHWFTWQHSPETSPYGWVDRLKVNRLPHTIFDKYLLSRLSDLLAHGIGPRQGVMTLQWWYIPVRNWHYFDIAVKKPWKEAGFVEGHPTLFEILTDRSVPYKILELTGGVAAELSDPRKMAPLSYFFTGDLDTVSHRFGQDGGPSLDYLRQLDRMLQGKYELFSRQGSEPLLVVFSDHGHLKVKEKIHLKAFFASQGESLDRYIYFLDTSYARFWFRNAEEERRVTRVFSQMEDKGFFLTESHFKKYKVNMPDNRFGDLIFYLDVPNVFTHGMEIWGRRVESGGISGHGMLPDYPDLDGTLVSNLKVPGSTAVELVDIMPSVLDMLGMEVPVCLDGKVLWEK